MDVHTVVTTLIDVIKYLDENRRSVGDVKVICEKMQVVLNYCLSSVKAAEIVHRKLRDPTHRRALEDVSKALFQEVNEARTLILKLSNKSKYKWALKGSTYRERAQDAIDGLRKCAVDCHNATSAARILIEDYSEHGQEEEFSSVLEPPEVSIAATSPSSESYDQALVLKGMQLYLNQIRLETENLKSESWRAWEALSKKAKDKKHNYGLALDFYHKSFKHLSSESYEAKLEDLAVAPTKDLFKMPWQFEEAKEHYDAAKKLSMQIKDIEAEAHVKRDHINKILIEVLSKLVQDVMLTKGHVSSSLEESITKMENQFRLLVRLDEANEATLQTFLNYVEASYRILVDNEFPAAFSLALADMISKSGSGTKSSDSEACGSLAKLLDEQTSDLMDQFRMLSKLVKEYKHD